jgi:hypothetical protein
MTEVLLEHVEVFEQITINENLTDKDEENEWYQKKNRNQGEMSKEH